MNRPWPDTPIKTGAGNESDGVGKCAKGSIRFFNSLSAHLSTAHTAAG